MSRCHRFRNNWLRPFWHFIFVRLKRFRHCCLNPGFLPLSRDTSMTIRGALSLINRPERCNSTDQIEREYILFNKRSSVNLYSRALRKSVTSHFRSKTSLTRQRQKFHLHLNRSNYIKNQRVMCIENEYLSRRILADRNRLRLKLELSNRLILRYLSFSTYAFRETLCSICARPSTFAHATQYDSVTSDNRFRHRRIAGRALEYGGTISRVCYSD